jgi:hypothetical protein
MMYATAGMGAVDPGIDISHYGAPYAQMLGVGNSGDGLGMLFRYGAGLGWTPGPGQTPADDPRILSRLGKFQQTYKATGPSGWGTGNTVAAADALLRAARKQFTGQTVRKLGTTGWTSTGRIGFEVTLAQPMRWGEIKAKGKLIESANPLSGVYDGLRLTDALTQKLSGTLAEPSVAADPAAVAELPAGPEPEEASGGDEGFLTQKIAGLPVWGIGIMGFGIVGGIAYLALRKKPASVTANRRRRSSKKRRRSRRRSRR